MRRDGKISQTANRAAVDPRAMNPQTAEATPPSIIIVGLGNDLVGDDGVGLIAARRVREKLAARSNVDVCELPWAGLALLDVLRDYDRAILIDALCSEGRHPPGTVVRLSEQDLAGSVRLNSFHDLNYPTALALGRALGWRLPRDIALIAVEGESFLEFTTRLSPSVEAALDTVVRLVLRIVNDNRELESNAAPVDATAADVA
jgi:hydrogenase maturation protease